MAPVITLCGSTLFKVEFIREAQRLGEEGWLVISLTTFTHADELATTDETKAMLDAVHMQKIMMSDAIQVINVNGYIGDSTRREIAFAALQDKRIFFCEEPTASIYNMIRTINNVRYSAGMSARLYNSYQKLAGV